MSTAEDRVKQLRELIKQRILVVDGAMGTSIQAYDLTAEDFGSEELYGCNENLILTRPDVIEEIHRGFLEAGADIIESNTFGATPLVLDEYDLGHKCYEINKVGAELARKAADAVSTPDKPRFVAGSVGPTTKAITVTGGITFDGLADQFYQQALGLIDGGVDYFLIETCQDTINIKACVCGVQKAMEERGVDLPLAVSGTIETTGTMLAGQTIEALYVSVMHLDLLYIGMNCATGPAQMVEHLERLAAISHLPVSCLPNAGLPDEDGNYLESPDMMGVAVKGFADRGLVNVIGGCCGTTSKHIKAMADAVAGYAPRELKDLSGKSYLSGISFVSIEDDKGPYLVGERTNVIGSRKFKRLITENSIEEASELARGQEKAGAHVIDICLSNPERDEIDDVELFYPEVIKKIKAPIMIDSTDRASTEAALKHSQGKAIINSINLEDGLERFDEIVPLAKKYGAALVVGCIDEDPDHGMAVTRQRKLEIAERSYNLLVNDYGIREEDIYFDPLVFPCATGDENYTGSAVETIEGIRMIKEKFPRCRFVLGISNVSFGLPVAGREILNNVFMHHCVRNGLDAGIVNAAKHLKFEDISEEEIKLCEDLMWNRGEDPIATFAAFYRGKKIVKKKETNLPPDERLANCVLEGTKEGLIVALEEKLKDTHPLDIINGPLMVGMGEVGRLFKNNEMIVAEVLQSAEVMKAAVAHLEPKMSKEDGAAKGKMVLATVKGDVHDIGKNLVDIILSNNGFAIENLGIKIPSDRLIEAVKKHNPDMIGLSGLLVKSAQQMIITAKDMAEEGIDTPLVVGGAALTQKFVETRIAPVYNGPVLYAKDAMHGLELAQKIIDGDVERVVGVPDAPKKKPCSCCGDKVAKAPIKSNVEPVDMAPASPDLERHIQKNISIDTIWKYNNDAMLFSKNLGFRGNFRKAVAEGDAKAVELKAKVDAVYEKYKTVSQPKAVYQFFKAASRGNSVDIYSQSNELLSTFDFPRQEGGNHLCLADYVLPLDEKGEPVDNVSMFVVTAGEGVRAVAEADKEKGEFLTSHMLQAIALCAAESYAEYLHFELRRMWGIIDGPETTMKDLFAARYQGNRYSPGYPACPDLELQENIWKLLHPQDIGCELTDGCMMEPEASVSAIVFHHPECKYYSVGEER